MDSYREYPSDFDLTAATEAEAIEAANVASVIGTDERRMHVRAYNYWVSLLDGRDFPSIEDLEPNDVRDFSGHSVLLDFTCGGNNPAIPYIGAAIRDECGLDDDTRTISEVPSRSLLSRLTDHYMQIIANRAPVGFEAEFDNQRDDTICYRGILMPFSSDGETIDFIYGVINWKKSAETSPVPYARLDQAEDPTLKALELTSEIQCSDIVPFAEADADDEDDNISPAVPILDIADRVEAEPPVELSWSDGALGDADDAAAQAVITLDEDAGLADRLWAARETAESMKAGEGRTRAALYTALALAYDFAVAAEANPEDYAELLEESGVKAQVRAPMTPIAKLVFGIDYDKARLTEFAAALSFARRANIALGGFGDFIGSQPGGLKALVAAERQARRPEPKTDTRTAQARAKLLSSPPIALADVQATDEFTLVLTRRAAGGGYEAVAVIDDQGLLERAIRRAA